MQPETEIETAMSLTEREKQVLSLANQGLSDYRIARKIEADPPSVTRSRRHGLAKLKKAKADLMWAQSLNLKF
jgi:DNA-binding NarL/FixJ family response regulator